MPTPTLNDLKRLISAYPRMDFAGAGVSGLTGALRATANEAQRLLTVHLMKTILVSTGWGASYVITAPADSGVTGKASIYVPTGAGQVINEIGSNAADSGIRVGQPEHTSGSQPGRVAQPPPGQRREELLTVTSISVLP